MRAGGSAQPWLSDNTDITTVAATNATVAARKRTVPGVLVDVKYSVATYGGPAQYLSDLTTAPIFVQSFDPASSKYLRSAGLKTKVVQLIDGNDVIYQTGAMIYQANDEYNFVDGRPCSWTVAGDGHFFGDLLTPDGLAEVKTYADGIGPWKPQVMALKSVPYKTGDGLSAVNTATPTSLIADAHAAGLFVHVYTFRNETKYLAGLYHGDPTPEYSKFFAAGVDGVFIDFSNTAFAARKQFLEGYGQ